MTIGSEHHGDAVMPPNVGNKEQYHYDTTMYHSPPTLNKYHLCLEVGPLPPTRPRRSLKMTSRTSRKKTSRPRNRSLPARRIAAARVVQRSEMPIDPGFFRGVKKRKHTHTHPTVWVVYTFCYSRLTADSRRWCSLYCKQSALWSGQGIQVSVLAYMTGDPFVTANSQRSGFEVIRQTNTKTVTPCFQNKITCSVGC